MSNDTINAVERHVTPIADDFGVELVDIEFNNGVLKVVIDEEGGLNSQTLVDMTKAISRMIDAEDPVPGKFTLEVTSPGVERPLKKPAHFQRAIGAEVSVKTEPDVEGERRIEGVLAEANAEGIRIAAEVGDRSLRYGEIRTARTVFHWGPAPKPGGKEKNHKKKESAST
ncbi:MAG: ribosome maturation factor RimP [Acidimicrobiales bacterium]|nr:ribosome maturation factor RimP [Acidimicrobiales bacterium]